MAKKSTSKQAESTKKTVTDTQLEKLAAPLIKTGASATAIIKTLRQSGYSFSGKRVRVMVAAKPAPKATKATAKPKGKPAAKKADNPGEAATATA